MFESVETPGERGVDDIAVSALVNRYLAFDGDADLVIERIRKGLAHLWPVEAGAIVTEVSDGGCLNIWKAGGSLHVLPEVLPVIEQFAWALGCPAVEVRGRKGWGRVLKHYGYAVDGERMVKHGR